MNALSFIASDADERLNHRAQNARLDRAVERRRQPRFAIVFASVPDGPVRLETMLSGGAVHRYSSQPMRRELVGVDDRATGIFLTVGSFVEALADAVFGGEA